MSASNGMCGAETEVVLVEQELSSIKLAVLDLIRTEIVSNVEPRRHFTYLRSRNVLDERDCDEIKAIPSRAASAEKFIDILMKKGSKGYDEFCKALMYDQTQTFLLTKLSMKLDILRARVLEHKRQNKIRQAVTEEKLRPGEQQSHAIRQLQKQPRQQEYHHHLHKQLSPSLQVANGRNNLLHVPLQQQQQPQQTSPYHHGYPTNITATGPISGSTSPVRSHSPMGPAYTHHHLTGAFTLPPNLALHGGRQYQVATAVGQDSSRQDFYHASTGRGGLAQTYSSAAATQPRGWSPSELMTMVTGPQPMVGWNSYSEPCGQPLLACRGQDEA